MGDSLSHLDDLLLRAQGTWKQKVFDPDRQHHIYVYGFYRLPATVSLKKDCC